MPKKYKNTVETEFKADDRFSRAVGKMSSSMSRLHRMSGRAKRALKSAAKMTLSLGRALSRGLKVGAIAGAASIGLVATAAWKLSSAFSTIEDAEASFTPLMGGAKRAKMLVEALNKTAATTPFQFETLASTAQQLLPSMNGNIEKTISLTRMLGDTAGGNMQKMDSITRGFNKSLLKGKVDLESLNMISEAGVPIFQQLGLAMGISTKRLFKMISAGKISTKDLSDTFQVMTSKGGIFFKGMEIASETRSGVLSTLSDNVKLAAAQFGEAMNPAIKRVAKSLTVVAQNVTIWAMANKDLIRQKFELYFNRIITWGKKAFTFLQKNIPPLIKKLKQIGTDGFAWVKENKSEILSFFGAIKSAGSMLLSVAGFVIKHKAAVLALVIAYKTLGLSLSLLNWSGMAAGAGSAATAIGGLQGKVKGLAGMLGGKGILLSSFAAGAAVGLLIFDQWNKSSSDMALNFENAANRISRSFHKMSNLELKTADKQLASKEKNIDTLWNATKAFVTGNLSAHESAVKAVKDARIKGLSERLGRFDTGNNSNAPATAQTPQAQVARSENVTVEKVELTIKDETGKAQVSNRSGVSGLTLAHNGGV